MVNNNPFDVTALSGRVSAISDKLKTARQGFTGGGYTFTDERTPLQNELAKTQAEMGVAEQYQSDLMAANMEANNRLNLGALASSRRRAGGNTFRRRRSGVTANDLAPNVGAANARSLAETRRARALADLTANQSNQSMSVSLGPQVRLW
jgi:hypothetical protein